MVRFQALLMIKMALITLYFSGATVELRLNQLFRAEAICENKGKNYLIIYILSLTDISTFSTNFFNQNYVF